MTEIRLASYNDIQDLSDLNFQFNGVRVEHEQIKESMKNSTEIIAVALNNGKCIGFATAQFYKSFCYVGNSGEITEMFVLEEFRRSGVASNLLSFLEQELKLKKVKGLKVLTGSTNVNALSAYTKADFKAMNEIVLSKKI